MAQPKTKLGAKLAFRPMSKTITLESNTHPQEFDLKFHPIFYYLTTVVKWRISEEAQLLQGKEAYVIGCISGEGQV